MGKRKIEASEEENTEPPSKAQKKFSAKELRAELKTQNKQAALLHFIEAIETDSAKDFVLSYLEAGGNCLEILKTLESESDADPVLVFDLLNRILLRICVKYTQHQTGAFESCKYLLTNYVTQINKMLGMSSTGKQRSTILKLLTTVVTFSALLAKEILLHVNFNPTNLELLTKTVGGANETRDAFIHFLVAFLVDGHFPTMSVLLEKRGLLTSIIAGLRFDKPDTVVLVMTALKNHILENPNVSKTLKMKTFSTPVVKDVVKLYNWKGPAGFQSTKKKTKNVVVVDEVEKSTVSEAVHSFLLVLCTSHRLGVIFHDPQVGLGKRHLNILMYSVLSCLERPWEHSYAGQLVLKICGACPDLAKTMWTNLKTVLEPRSTLKWSKAVKFAADLLDVLRPECVQYCVKDLNSHQLAQIISTLATPLPILKVMDLASEETCSASAVKHQIFVLLLKMIETVHIYQKTSKTWTHINQELLSQAITANIVRNFPNAELILQEPQSDEEVAEELEPVSRASYLTAAFDLLEHYKTSAPKLLEGINAAVDVEQFLMNIAQIEADDLLVKAAKFFVDLNAALFRPKTHLFDFITRKSWQIYHQSGNRVALQLLNSLLRNSSIFVGHEGEINVWIDGVLNCKSFTDDLGLFLINLIKSVSANICRYNEQLSAEIKMSPMILGVMDNVDDCSKAVKNYLNFVVLNLFHSAGHLEAFCQTISVVKPLLAADLSDYIDGWTEGRIIQMQPKKNTGLDRFRQFSGEFFDATFDYNFDLYQDLKLNLLQAAVFYLSRLIEQGQLDDKLLDGCLNFVKTIQPDWEDDRYIRTIFNNGILLNHLTLFGENHCTKFVLESVKYLRAERCDRLETYLSEFRVKVVSAALKVLKKPQKYPENMSVAVLTTLKLDYDQCAKIVNKFAADKESARFYDYASYCLMRMSELAADNYDLVPLDADVIAAISHHFALTLFNQSVVAHSLHNYLKVFPHSIASVAQEFVEALLQLPDYDRDKLQLCAFLLDRRPQLFQCFWKNFDQLVEKKSFILTLLSVAISHCSRDDLEKIYTKLQPSIVKALQKPHKAGQHFHNHYIAVSYLVEHFMDVGAFAKQVEKFEVTETFHVHLLKKVFDKVEKTDKSVNNIILTFVRLLNSLLKDKVSDKLPELGRIFHDLLLSLCSGSFQLGSILQNESFQLCCKLCLKFGISSDGILLKILARLLDLCFDEDAAALVLDMFLSHSQFLDAALGDHNKEELMELWAVLIGKWPQLMERTHVPVILAAYGGTNRSDDRWTLKLLKMYESAAARTSFFDFKPFLWGRAAANYYSVRSFTQERLWRQPKTSDVLDCLREDSVIATIDDSKSVIAYDLNFFMPLFDTILAPDSVVATYKFIRSGALSLTVAALRDDDQDVRLLACRVLSRLYFHLEARQSGKDNLLWLRFVKVVAMAAALSDNQKLNSFSAIFLAKAGLILTNPNLTMYLPLSQYLAAKESLDFNTIPELYTLLHSAEVNFRDHRTFILTLVRDGLGSEKDLTVFLRTMCLKMMLESCSSCVCDLDTKLLILDVLSKCCDIPLGVKVLCGSAFLVQIFNFVGAHLHDKKGRIVVDKVLDIACKIAKGSDSEHVHFFIYLSVMKVLKNDPLNHKCYEILSCIVDKFTKLFACGFAASDDSYCKYLTQYGCAYVRVEDLDVADPAYYKKMFYLKMLK